MRYSLFFQIEWENLFTLSPMYQSRGKNRHSKSLQGLFFSRQVVFCLCSRRVDRSTLLRHFKYYYECFKIGAIQLELLFSGFVFVYLQGWLGWSPRTQKRQLLKQEGGGGDEEAGDKREMKKKAKVQFTHLWNASNSSLVIVLFFWQMIRNKIHLHRGREKTNLKLSPQEFKLALPWFMNTAYILMITIIKTAPD